MAVQLRNHIRQGPFLLSLAAHRDNSLVCGVGVQPYLHQIPALEGLGDDGCDRRTDASKHHQMVRPILYRIVEGFQALCIVTLGRNKERARPTLETGSKPKAPSWGQTVNLSLGRCWVPHSRSSASSLRTQPPAISFTHRGKPLPPQQPFHILKDEATLWLL